MWSALVEPVTFVDKDVEAIVFQKVVLLYS